MSAPAQEASATQVVARLSDVRILPVVTVEDAEHARGVGEALLAGGVGCIEIALRTPCAAEAIRRAREVDGLLVGAGTVLSVAALEAAIEAGAQFAVAPGLNEDVVAAAQELRLPFFPGVATPTEIDRAQRLGLTTVKVFPAAQIGGVAFLRAVSATYPEVGFIPTGGIGPASLGEYLALDSVIACGGTWLAPPNLVPERLDEVQRLAREAAEAVS